MKRTLIATVLSVSLVSGFGISNASADELEGILSVSRNATAPAVEATDGHSDLIARRGGGGGVRRGGGGFRRGGGGATRRASSGMRRGGGMRGSGGMRRSGGMRSAGTHRSGGHSSNMRRSNGTRSQHASQSRSNNSNSRSNNRSNSKGGNSKNGKNNHASRGNDRGNHGGHNGGRDGGGWDGGAWDGGGWDRGAWDGGTVIPVEPIVPVVPVVVDPRPAVITLMNPAQTRTSLNYTLGESQYVIGAGETSTFEEGTQVIAFDRGGSFGEARYTLEPGASYKFVSTDHGWDLHSVTAVAATDSAGSDMAEADTSKSNGGSALTMVSGS